MASPADCDAISSPKLNSRPGSSGAFGARGAASGLSLDVLDAQRTANTAQLAYLGSRRNRLAAAVDLFKALGGGWRDTSK